MIVRLLAKIIVAITLASLAVSAGAQHRTCLYNGVEYQDGDRVGGFVCRDGQWVAG